PDLVNRLDIRTIVVRHKQRRVTEDARTIHLRDLQTISCQRPPDSAVVSILRDVTRRLRAKRTRAPDDAAIRHVAENGPNRHNRRLSAGGELHLPAAHLLRYPWRQYVTKIGDVIPPMQANRLRHHSLSLLSSLPHTPEITSRVTQ